MTWFIKPNSVGEFEDTIFIKISGYQELDRFFDVNHTAEKKLYSMTSLLWVFLLPHDGCDKLVGHVPIELLHDGCDKLVGHVPIELSHDGCDKLVGHVPIELSRLLYHFLNTETENKLIAVVSGKRKREIGLVVPAKFTAMTTRKKFAEILMEKLEQKKDIIDIEILENNIVKLPFTCKEI